MSNVGRRVSYFEEKRRVGLTKSSRKKKRKKKGKKVGNDRLILISRSLRSNTPVLTHLWQVVTHIYLTLVG